MVVQIERRFVRQAWMKVVQIERRFARQAWMKVVQKRGGL